MPSLYKCHELGLSPKQAIILCFLYKQDGKSAETIRIGRDLYPESEYPTAKICSSLGSLLRRKFVEKLMRGYYRLTEKGMCAVEDIKSGEN